MSVPGRCRADVQSLQHSQDDCVLLLSDSSSGDDIEITNTQMFLRREGHAQVRHGWTQPSSCSQPEDEVHDPCGYKHVRRHREQLLRKADETVARISASNGTRRAERLRAAKNCRSLEQLLPDSTTTSTEYVTQPTGEVSTHDTGVAIVSGAGRSEEYTQKDPTDSLDDARNSVNRRNTGRSIADMLAPWTLQELSQARGENERLKSRLMEADLLLEEQAREIEDFQLRVSERELELYTKEKQAADQHNLCVICLDADASHVVIPCGHLVYCDKCPPAPQCPVCRISCVSVLRMYKP